jgi:hypothetical protein
MANALGPSELPMATLRWFQFPTNMQLVMRAGSAVEAIHVKQRMSIGPGYSAAWSRHLQTEKGGLNHTNKTRAVTSPRWRTEAAVSGRRCVLTAPKTEF